MPARDRDGPGAACECECGLLVDLAKAKARDAHSPRSHASSQLINVPSESQLAVVTDASGSDSDAEEPLLAQPPALAPGPAARKDRVAVGMIWYATSSIFFAGMGVCSKLLGQQGYPVWEITFFRAIIIMTIALAMIVSQGDNPLGHRRGLLLLRGTLGYGSITSFFLACQMLPLADATTFTFLAPLLVALLSPLVLKERLGAATAVVIPLCIAGVLLIAQPSFLFGHGGGAPPLPPLGLVFGLLQPLFSATAKMTVRLLRTTEKTNVMVLYLMVCTLVYSTAGCALTRSQLVVPTATYDLALLVGQGLFGYGNQVCITKGLANARAASVMCMQYLSIVISQAAGMALFGEFTTWRGGVGMALVVLSMVFYMWWETARKSRGAR